jgi:hypothetical protein
LTKQTGIAPENIIDYFDHEIDDPKTRKRLMAFFRGDPEDFCLAGKYDDAAVIILEGVQEIFDEYKKSPQSFASDAWDARPVVDKRLLSYRDRISSLYADEEKKLTAVIDRWAAKIDVNEIQGAATDTVQQLGETALRESLAWGRWLGGVAKTLGTRCCLAGIGTIPAAAAGLSLGAAASALAGPLAALGIAGIVGGFFTPETVGQLKKKLFRLEFLKASTTDSSLSGKSEAETNFRIEVSMFIASLATWAAIRELQGLSPESLAERLPPVLAPIETAAVDSQDTIRQAFAESRRILEST